MRTSDVDRLIKRAEEAYNRSKMHDAWREFEAYAEPVTEDGVKAMQRRYNQFRAGWNAAIEASVKRLMEEHYDHDHIHNSYHVAANIVERIKDER